jgi:hypothetical protein
MYNCAWYSHRQVIQVQPQHSLDGHNDTCTIEHGTVTGRSYRYGLSTRHAVKIIHVHIVQLCMVQPQADHTGTASCMFNYTVHGTATSRPYRYSLIHVQLYSTVQRQAVHTGTASYIYSTIVQYMVQRQTGHTGIASYKYKCTVHGTATGSPYRYSLIHVQLYSTWHSDRQVIWVQP